MHRDRVPSTLCVRFQPASATLSLCAHCVPINACPSSRDSGRMHPYWDSPAPGLRHATRLDRVPAQPPAPTVGSPPACREACAPAAPPAAPATNQAARQAMLPAGRTTDSKSAGIRLAAQHVTPQQACSTANRATRLFWAAAAACSLCGTPPSRHPTVQAQPLAACQTHKATHPTVMLAESM